MLKAACLIARKDLRLVLSRGAGLVQALLLGLLLLPTPVQSVLLGKAAAGLCIILTAQFLFLPATIVFLGQSLGDGWPLALLALVLTDIGMASLGSLLGALSQGQAARESLLSIVLFPLIIPILLAGIRVCAGGFSEALPEGVESWLGIAVAFDAVFLAAGLVLFPFVFSGDE